MKTFRLLAIGSLLAGCSGGEGLSAEKATVELCDNGIDDTGNGLADCSDPSCSSNLACSGPRCGDGIKQTGEVCDGGDFAGSTCMSLGFSGGALRCASSCARIDTGNCTGSTTCGNGMVDNGEACDGNAMGGATCETRGFVAGGVLNCRNDCSGFDDSGCVGVGSTCGNGALDQGEVCDGAALNNETCITQGFELGGTLACGLDCRRFDTRNCRSDAQCGNGFREGREDCDGNDLGNASCFSLGFAQGSGLSCNPGSCTFNTSNCVEFEDCGNNDREGTEVCDGSDLNGRTCETEGFAGGTLDCTLSCNAFDTSECTAPSTCNGGSRDPGELCDGNDVGAETCLTQGYGGGTLGCEPGCTRYDTSQCFGTPNCGNGSIDGNEACDGAAWGLTIGPSCSEFGLGNGTVSCSSTCGVDFSSCQQTDFCAVNGFYNDGAICDPCELLGGTADPDCATLCGAEDNVCSNTFSQWGQVYVCDAAGIEDPDCGACGNGSLNGAELCDGSDFRPGQNTCLDYGFVGGTLGCRDDCTPNLADCRPAVCGNGIIEGNEVCDDNQFSGATCQSEGFGGGFLVCANECQTIETTSCTGDVNYENGSLDGIEYCDSTSGPFRFGSNECRSIRMGAGTYTCNEDGVSFDGCQLWNGSNPVSADYCAALNLYNDGGNFCDPCPQLGGTLDPDCLDHCGADGICADYYSDLTKDWTCPSPDPDCGTCGNGVVEGQEQCDGNSLNPNQNPTCEGRGFAGGTLGCREDCTFNYTNCTAAVCGNGFVEGSEVCDGGSVSCSSLGAASGTATCKADCTGYDTSSCSGLGSCGNGRIETDTNGFAYEFCDGATFHQFPGFAATELCSTWSHGTGNVTCNADCSLNFSACSAGGDRCTIYGLRGDGICHLCEKYGGAPDPDCDPAEPTFGCGLDGICHAYNIYSQSRSCAEKGVPDPDCGFCGNGRRETSGDEFCDGDDFGFVNTGGTFRSVDCTDYGYSGGTLDCTPTCMPDLGGCIP